MGPYDFEMILLGMKFNRGHYICTTHASRIMVPQKSGLIVNISSGGGLRYLFNVAYGVGKES